MLDDFVFVGHDHQAMRGSGYDFLAQQSAPATLDQCQAGSHLVGAVDSHIGIAHFIKAGERNAQRACQLSARARGRYPNLQSIADQFPEKLDGKGRRRAGTQSDHHPILDEFQALSSRNCFFSIGKGHDARKAREDIRRVKPLIRRLMPTIAPSAHTALAGQLLQIITASIRVTIPSNKSQPEPGALRS